MNIHNNIIYYAYTRMHAHTHARTHAHTHACTHICTHTHTHSPALDHDAVHCPGASGRWGLTVACVDYTENLQ